MIEQLQDILPIVIPFIVIALIIVGVALLDLRKQTSTRGPKWMWVLIVCFITFVGPFSYFMIGRKEE
jgi:ABC-type spermidine/putrescine transport system permease subunit II